MKISYSKLIVSIAICLFAGGIGSFFTMDAIPNWYASLLKPIFNPPNWIFGPVWTTLYILMGIALYLFWTTKAKISKKKAYYFFFIQLVLNTFWSIIFFGLQSPFLGLVEIIILWIFILLTILEFNKFKKIAAYLLIPYLLWVSFASVLNLFIYLLNK